MVDTTAGEVWADENRRNMNARVIVPGFVVTADEVATLLALSAMGMNRLVCEAGIDCPHCNDARKLWWDLCNALPRQVARDLQAYVRKTGDDLPAGPWEVVE